MAADVHSERENPDLTTAEADVADVAGHPVAAGDAEPTADAGPESADSAEPAGGDETVNDAAVDDAAAGTGTAVGDAAPAPQGPRRIRVLLVVAALALTIDVISKLLVVAHLSDRDPIRLPGGFLRLTLVRNSGAAFSIGESQTWMFTIIAAAVVVVILRISRNLRSLGWACALGLLLGGALGNLSDRIFRSPGLFRGHVVDFLQFPRFPVVDYDFPVFNLADSAIVVGGCLMVLLSFLGRQPDGTRHTKAGPVEPAGRDGGDSRDSRD